MSLLLNKYSLDTTPTPANDNSYLQLVINNAGNLTNIADALTTYTTAPSKNRLTAVGGQSVTTDNNGSITGLSTAMPSGLTTLVYNAAGRLASALSASATLQANTYDATGARVKKVAGGVTTTFVKGLGGELLQENPGAGRFSYIYANGVPVAQFNASGTLTYLHTDQRGAPVKATNASKATQWSTRYEPFGQTIGLTNPGNLTMNLRLPGQIADAETSLYDNGFRTYSPREGRYWQSDPIGLAGGANTYGYVTANPFRYVDPWGLARSKPFDLGNGYTGVTDTFNSYGGQASFEIHVSNVKGKEVGVYGPNGWINKHGFKGSQSVPQCVEEALASKTADLLKRIGLSGSFMNAMRRFNMILMAIDLGAHAYNGTDPLGNVPTPEDVLGDPERVY